jgi:hypothetical protein
MLLLGSTCSAATTIRFSLEHDYSTSAGVYDSSGVLVRTLWSGRPFTAGTHAISWDDLDDHGRPVTGMVAVRLLRHRVIYHWDGVIGNTSAAFTGPGVHHAMFPPTSIAIWGERAVYAVGYNEGLPGTHGFALADPQIDVPPLSRADPFTGWSLVATDGERIYWASTSGLSHATFIAASTFGSDRYIPFPTGRSLCLNRNGPNCYPDQTYEGVIDVDEAAGGAATGLAVQPHGNVLAVAHGHQGVLKLYDKRTGALLGDLPIPRSEDATNQLATAPSGDLWVVGEHTVHRYTGLGSAPREVASITDLRHPLAVAVDPRSEDLVLVADGASSQQVKAYDRHGKPLWTYGEPGGYGADPTVGFDRLWFRFQGAQERTALAVQPDGSFWIIDTCNDRMLRVSADRKQVAQVAYLPVSYSATVDPSEPRRVFANYLEFRTDFPASLRPGPHAGWVLVRNWLAGLPSEVQSATTWNGGFSGLQTVVTLSNQHTYALSDARPHGTALLELPESGPARFIRSLPAPAPGDSPVVLYANGDLGYSHKSKSSQSVYRLTLSGFTPDDSPIWQLVPRIVGSAPVSSDAPTGGAISARIPISASGKLIFLDAAVDSAQRQTHYHLGAVALGGGKVLRSENWLWKTSPEGTIDQPGAFQTKAIDGTVHYGGNNVWTVGRHIVYGYHGEGFTDPINHRVGEANQFVHFFDDGLFIGQFGVPTTRATMPAAPGVAGNSFSNILIEGHDRLFLFHNDESQHGGVHRWTLSDLASIHEMIGSGAVGQDIVVH